MRVLYLSRADEFRDKSSLVIIAKSVFRHMLEADPQMYVTWVVPRGTSDDVLHEYVLAPLGENARRMGFVKCMAGVAGRTLGYFLTEDVWYALTQTKVDVPYDVVLNNQLALTPIYATVLANRYQASRYHVDVPIVNWQMWTATTQQLREVPEYYAGEADIVAESLASSFAYNVWESQVLLKAHLDTLREYVTPSVIRKVTAQSEVIANGVDWPRLFEVYQQRKVRQQAWRDSDRLGMDARLFWGGRLANQKKPRVTFPLMAEVQRVTGVDVVVSTNRPESDPDVAWCHETFPRWTLYTGVDRTAFFGLMAQGDVFMCDSPSESYGVAWLEMLATGMLGVFAPAWWNDTLLPEWYPFRHEDPEVRVQMAAALIEQWPDGELWTKYVPLVREWIEHEHNEQRCGVALASTLHVQKVGSLDRDRGKGSGSVGQLAHAAALGIWQSNEQPIPEQQVYARMTELSDTHREWGKPGDLVSRMYLRRCLEAAGWIDLCRSREVEYVLQA
jgi:hypothetical protein